jgi:hypothetical protein
MCPYVLKARGRRLVGEVRRGRVRARGLRLLWKVRRGCRRAVAVWEFIIVGVHLLYKDGDVGWRGYVLGTRTLNGE